MILHRTMGALLLSVALLGLAGCESAKDKAARHLASALELIDKGDADRALVEFRNVFQLDPENVEARARFAAFLRDRGDLPGAYAQFQAVIDREPQNEEALRGAAEVAAKMGNWPEAGRQASALLALTPGDGAIQAIKLASDYAAAATAGDAKGRDAAEAEAKRQLVARPDDLYLRRVVIDARAQNRDFKGALTALDVALQIFPEEVSLYTVRVSLMAALEDKAGVEATLIDMDKRFADPGAGATLLRWYVSNNEMDKAEAWLRAKAEAPGNAGLEARVQLILFLKQARSPDAALAEIEAALKLAPEAPDPAAPDTSVTQAKLRVLGASILFDAGRRDEGIAAMKAILDGAPPSDEMRLTKVTLARMYLTVGDLVQSRALTEEVLKEEPGNIEAAKLKSGWLIDEDKTDDAVATLRAALEQAPGDAQTMSLLAEAYGRAGSRDLQADMLSQAVEASGKAPGESLRYASFLATDQKYLPAEAVLVNALRLAPDNLEILAALGDIYLRLKDWPRAEGVANRLEEIGSPEARAIADRLRPIILSERDNVGAAVDYLRGLAQGSGDLRNQVALISAYLSDGKQIEARALAADILAKAPDDLNARYIMASVQGATGEGKAAIETFRALVTEEPKAVQLWIALIRQSAQENGQPSIPPLVDEALTHLPDMPDLLLMKANILEGAQDIEGAIAIYEKLYAADSGNLAVANNLASLLSSYRTDKESLDRAWTVARRLNGTDIPALADTYGWLAHLRGQTTEALPYLELAAKGLAQDPMVQFHYAEALKAAGKGEEAKLHYGRVLELVPPEDSRAFAVTARKELGQ
ncbi:tetratricopeptide repeat protein [Stagnihabitans tardus]|uniref:Tetratricopeptide repeat protein n=1 Tax=Stagnihabitans tardus TaxID=2699202 RepID=A0AAE4YGQ4_9RHOB|nr:tetratricopeptide repeat protein [Stagnihabitans tardus]NBZ89665.1 tetratricopeptide repeat protein [Stagnihabitans tardus]